MTRRRRLTADERTVWGRVARSVDPLGRGDRPGAEAMPVPSAPGPAAREAAPAPPAMPGPLPAFRVGERAQTASSAHGIAPRVGDAPPAGDAPLRMDGRTHRRMRRGKLQPEARIDLHGLTLDRAQPALAGFVRASHAAGRRLVLVITGKGRADDGSGDWTGRRPGALRRQVPTWLAGPGLAGIVQQVTPAHRRHGGDGALYVYLRRPR